MGYIYEKKSLKMTGLYITYNRGGLYEKEGEYGTSHLMEHLICKTFTDKYPMLTRLSIDFNAYTDNEIIVVHFTGMDKYFTPEIKKELVDKLLGGLNITKEEFEAEKKVVLQEYMDNFNDPECMNNLIREKFGYYSTIGRRSDIENFTYEDMKEHYEKYYRTPAKIIEVGPTKTDFSYVTYKETSDIPPRKLKFAKNYKGMEYEVLPENQKSSVRYLGKKLVKKGDFPALTVAISMLVGGLESPMQKRIREEKALCYGVSGGNIKLINEAMTYFGATTDKENKDNLVNEFNTFFQDIKKHLTQERYDDVINCINISFEENKIFRYANVGTYIRKGYIGFNQRDVKKLSLEKVQDVAAKYLNLDNLQLFIL